MPIAPSNGIEICYDTFGSPDDPVLMFVSGFGSQMIARHDEFCELAASRGFRFVRFDNRDVGLSTKSTSPYTLDDMAADAVGLLDHLGVEAAHVVGMSMGGMIAQLMAINHPGRVLSLASVMSHMSGDDVVPATPEAGAIFMVPAPTSREEAIERTISDRRVIGSPGFPFDEGDVREMAARSYDRSFYPEGRVRQALAIRSAPSREAALGKLEIPVTVIHGTEDPLIPVENGRATADAVPGAELVLIEGMGHDLPRDGWERIIDAIADNARRVAPAR